MYDMWMDGAEGNITPLRSIWDPSIIYAKLPYFLKPKKMEYKLIVKTGKSEDLKTVVSQFNSDIHEMTQRGWTPYGGNPTLSFDPYHHKVVISQMMYNPSTGPVPERITNENPE